ncbi:hypothetical protein GCM10007918_37660 [Piscinibacter gummiphilus]|nr:hypothetical protein GCM10007918_37660 [Piscinibacter gummiphilus]
MRDQQPDEVPVLVQQPVRRLEVGRDGHVPARVPEVVAHPGIVVSGHDAQDLSLAHTACSPEALLDPTPRAGLRLSPSLDTNGRPGPCHPARPGVSPGLPRRSIVPLVVPGVFSARDRFVTARR